MKAKVLLPLIFLFPLLGACDENLPNTLNGALDYARTHTFEVYGDAYYVYGAGNNYDETLMFKISNTFDEKVLDNKITYIYQIGTDTYESVSQNTVFAKDDGYSYYRTVDLTNSVVDIPVTDDNDKNVVFADEYSNPFKDLNYENILANDDQYMIIDPKVKNSFCLNILKQSISARKAYITFDKGRFDYLEITTSSSSSISSEISAYYRYELRFKWNAKAKEPEVKPYEHYASQEKLQTALYTLNRSINGHNYTATTEWQESTGKSTSKFYAVEGKVYSDRITNNASYGAIKNGNYWYQVYISNPNTDKEKVTIYDENPFNGDLIYSQYMKAAVELYEPDETGKVFTIYPEFAQLMTYYLAPYCDITLYVEDVTELSIKLDDSYKFESLNIAFADSYGNSCSVKVTYDDFNSTEIPANF